MIRSERRQIFHRGRLSCFFGAVIPLFAVSTIRLWSVGLNSGMTNSDVLKLRMTAAFLPIASYVCLSGQKVRQNLATKGKARCVIFERDTIWGLMSRRIAMVKRQFDMKKHDQASEDLKYWLRKTPQERIAAVTFLVKQQLKPGQKMDRTVFTRRKLK